MHLTENTITSQNQEQLLIPQTTLLEHNTPEQLNTINPLPAPKRKSRLSLIRNTSNENTTTPNKNNINSVLPVRTNLSQLKHTSEELYINDPLPVPKRKNRLSLIRNTSAKNKNSNASVLTESKIAASKILSDNNQSDTIRIPLCLDENIAENIPQLSNENTQTDNTRTLLDLHEQNIAEITNENITELINENTQSDNTRTPLRLGENTSQLTNENINYLI